MTNDNTPNDQTRVNAALGAGGTFSFSCLAYFLATWTLSEREIARFLRQRNRLIGALGQPVVFWVLFGQGLNSSFRPTTGDVGYAEYFFPGVLVLIVLFTAIFATISIIEDRREGFLQGVLIAPVPRAVVVLGKVLGGSLLALVQASLFMLLAPWAGIALKPDAVIFALLHLFVVAFGLTSLGVCLAWRTDSVQGFHALMSILLMPMWLLSGAFFPAEGAPMWLEWAILLNPLTYGLAGLRHLLYGDLALTNWRHLPSLGLCLFVNLMFAVLMFTMATRLASARGERS